MQKKTNLRNAMSPLEPNNFCQNISLITLIPTEIFYRFQLKETPRRNRILTNLNLSTRDAKIKISK